MVCFLKYWKGLHSCWILNSTQWSRDSRYCIPVFVNSENWIQDYLFLFPFYSNEREADFFLWDSGFPELYNWIPKFRIPDSTSKIFTDSGIQQTPPKFQDFGIQISSRRVIGVYSFNNFTYSDIDECTTSHPVCDVNANCTNIQGSYFCTCKTGFSGDGKTCQGRKTKALWPE